LIVAGNSMTNQTTNLVHCNFAQIAKERNIAYFELCNEILEKYFSMNEGKSEIEKTQEFREALRNYLQFNCEIQRRVFFGRVICDGLREEFDHELYERVYMKNNLLDSSAD